MILYRLTRRVLACPPHSTGACACAVCSLCLAEVGCSVNRQVILYRVLSDGCSRSVTRDRRLYMRGVLFVLS